MLKSKSVAKLIEDLLNTNDKDEKFRVVYELGGYKGTDINCVLKQGKGTITPIANYTNVRTPYTLEVVIPVQCGEDRIDGIVDIVNNFIIELNGKVKDRDNGKVVFLINPLEIGSYETRATVGQSAIIKVDFNVEYSTSSGTKYEIALITTQFDEGNVNTRYFKTREEQIAWFDKKIEDGAGYSEVLTPNINSLVLTKQRYLNSSCLDVNEVLMKNYAVIKETKENGDIKYYYYYVTNSNIGEYNLITVDLKMDTLQTHYIDLQFGDCFISKAHLNRWVEYGLEGKVKFDTTNSSPLFEREDFQNLDKQLVRRDVLSVVHTYQEEFDNWYKENILGWLYLFIHGGRNYYTAGVDLETSQKAGFRGLSYKSYDADLNYLTSFDAIPNTIPCLAVPVYKKGNRIRLRTNDSHYVYLDNKSVERFISDNSSDYIYSIKFSILPPFKISTVSSSGWTIEEDGDLKIDCTTYSDTSPFEEDGKNPSATFFKPTFFDNVYGVRAYSYDGYLYVLKQENVNVYVPYNYQKQTIFSKEEISSSLRDLKFNPKLCNSDFVSLKISDNTQNGAEYDILKLNASGDINLIYTEALTPDTTKVYLRALDKWGNGIYNYNNTTNLTGFVSVDDKSLVVETSAYQTMLANNKNFFLQNSTNRKYDVGQGVFGAVTGALQGAFFTGGNPLGAVVGAGVSVAQTVTSAIKNKTNQDFSVDNLKNAPNSSNGASGNFVFNAMYSETGIVVEQHEALEFEKKIADDQMFMNGFNFNKVANIKDYDNIRHYFNFIQATIENIIGDISNPIRDDIRQRFADGVRFWNVDEIKYEKENYERWLANE